LARSACNEAVRAHSGSNFTARSSATLRSVSQAMKPVKAAGPANVGELYTAPARDVACCV
jgi:hypothetical protein